MNFPKHDFEFAGLGGPYTATFAGLCKCCRSRIYTVNGEYPDPRGALGVKHSASGLVASEFDMVGADYLICYDCNQTREKYDKAVIAAKATWENAPLNRSHPILVELALAAKHCANVARNMRAGSFRGAVARVDNALKEYDSLP